MSQYSRVQVSNSVLLRRAAVNAAHDFAHTAGLLADLAEIDARKLYLPEACPSMLVFCVRELRYSEDEALKRIRVARVARLFPSIFDSVADSRLSLTAVVQLAPYLTSETAPDVAEGLIAAAAHKSKSEIQLLLAERFPRPDVAGQLVPVVAAPSPPDLPVPEPVGRLAPEPVPPKADGVEPLSPGRYKLQLTIDEETQALLQEAQELLSHSIAPRDFAGIFKRALRVLVPALRKQKFAATDMPRESHRRSNDSRHIPAHVKRAVWVRDGGQCTFVSESGKRCPARTLLEFDHLVEVARGGRATVDGMRLRCRAHNQYTAECAFGVEFMKHKREQAMSAAGAGAPPATSASAQAEVGVEGTAGLAPMASIVDALATSATTGAAAHGRIAPSEDQGDGQDVVSCLRQLGFRVDEARHAAAFCAGLSNACLEDRVRAALSFLRPAASCRRALPARHARDSRAPVPVLASAAAR